MLEERMKEPPDLVIARGKADLEAKTEIAVGLFGIGDADTRWSVDLDAGTITFSNPRKVAIAPVQVIGTYNTVDGTWLWGWDHPSVSKVRGEAAAQVRAYGLKHDISDFTTRKIACSEEDAWRFTGVASYLTGATGAYRGPSGTTLVFMTFGEVTLSAPQ
jgi:hypothetical protein